MLRDAMNHTLLIISNKYQRGDYSFKYCIGEQREKQADVGDRRIDVKMCVHVRKKITPLTHSIKS